MRLKCVSAIASILVRRRVQACLRTNGIRQVYPIQRFGYQYSLTSHSLCRYPKHCPRIALTSLAPNGDWHITHQLYEAPWMQLSRFSEDEPSQADHHNTRSPPLKRNPRMSTPADERKWDEVFPGFTWSRRRRPWRGRRLSLSLYWGSTFSEPSLLRGLA